MNRVKREVRTAIQPRISPITRIGKQCYVFSLIRVIAEIRGCFPRAAILAFFAAVYSTPAARRAVGRVLAPPLGADRCVAAATATRTAETRDWWAPDIHTCGGSSLPTRRRPPPERSLDRPTFATP